MGLHEQLARRAAPRHVDQGGRLLRVEVPDVVRRVLEVPLERAASGVERDDRAGVEVVAAALVADEVRARDFRPASRACRARDRRCRSARWRRQDDRSRFPSTSRSPAHRAGGRSRSATPLCRWTDRARRRNRERPRRRPRHPTPPGCRRQRSARGAVVLAPVRHLVSHSSAPVDRSSAIRCA